MFVWQEIHQLSYVLSLCCYVLISLSPQVWTQTTTSLLKSPSFLFKGLPNWPLLSISFAKQSLDHHFSQGPSTPSDPQTPFDPQLYLTPNSISLSTYLTLNSQLRWNWLFRGHITMSGGNFDCHTGSMDCAIDIWCMQTKDGAWHPVIHRGNPNSRWSF